MNNLLTAGLGETAIAKWRGGAQAAIALAFDDSLWSHVDYLIPLLVKKRLVGSFWVNPATNRYGYGIEMWEGPAQQLGMELCSHTMNHTGASSYKEANYEIGECTRILRSLRLPGSGRLMLFLRGGATTWKITDGQMRRLLNKYDLLRGRGGGIEHRGDARSGERLVGYARQALAEGNFHCIGFHGVGPQAEWLKASAPRFEKLVDYLARNRHRVWTGTCGEIHKYRREYQTARAVLRGVGPKRIELSLYCNENPAYYDTPLTLFTRVPKIWRRCLISQGDRKSVRRVRDGFICYDAPPNRGRIVLTPTRQRPDAAIGRPRIPYRERKAAVAGRRVFSLKLLPAAGLLSRKLSPPRKEAWFVFSFKLSRDFQLPRLGKDGDNSFTLLRLTDPKGRPVAAVHIYRRGSEHSLYVLVWDDKDAHGIPNWPETPAGRLPLKRGRKHRLLLHTRAGSRTGGAELWLDGRLRCSFMRRDTAARPVKNVEIGRVSAPRSMRGMVRAGEFELSGK